MPATGNGTFEPAIRQTLLVTDGPVVVHAKGLTTGEAHFFADVTGAGVRDTISRITDRVT